MIKIQNQEFFIADIRKDFRGDPYITFWRPKNSGYAYPLSWAGRYSKDELEPGYHYTIRYGTKRILERFPVACEVVERISENPSPGRIDNDAGPVVLNTRANRCALSRSRFVIATLKI